LEFFKVPGSLYTGIKVYTTTRTLLSVPKPIQGVKLAMFPSSRAYLEESLEFFLVPKIWGRAWNYPQFRGLYTERKVHMATRIASFGASLFWFSEPHISLYFPQISSYFLHISTYFPHILSYILTCFMSYAPHSRNPGFASTPPSPPMTSHSGYSFIVLHNSFSYFVIFSS